MVELWIYNPHLLHPTSTDYPKRILYHSLLLDGQALQRLRLERPDRSILRGLLQLVRNTVITETIVSFEELIIDVLLLPNGDCHVLDEEELPQPLEHFEKGKVHHDLLELTASLDKLLPMLLLDSESFASHEDITTYLQMNK